jgi:hypothetical protein
VEAGDLRCAICGQAVTAGTARREVVAVDVHRCRGCGAAVEYDPSVRAPHCAFCDRVMEVERIEDPVEQTEAFLPFRAPAEEARATLRAWLGTLGFFRPSDLRTEARVESLQPVWWVAWVFDAEAQVSWAADSDAGAGRSAWAPHAGRTRMVFDDVLVSASRGLSDDEITSVAPGYDLRTALPAPDGAEAALVERFDVQRSMARRRILAAVHGSAAARVEQSHVPGSKVRNLKVSVLLSGLETRRLAFPAYVLAYRYRDELFRVVVCGQDTSLLTGKAPWSVAKIAGAIAIGLLAILALAAVLLGSR